MLHKWEEPCISGNDAARGSGAIFFSGCPLRCVFCQNAAISRNESGTPVTPDELARTMTDLQQNGAYNINFVSPTQYTPLICDAIDCCRNELHIPKVWNTGGYEKPDTIRTLEGYADVFLTDFKYATPEEATLYAAAPDYPDFALASLRAMIDMLGKPAYDENGMLTRGVIVRHLVLPGERKNSLGIISLLKENFAPDELILSLMRQYTPDFYKGKLKNLHRKVTSFEYDSVISASINAGFTGFSQDADSASSFYTPDF